MNPDDLARLLDELGQRLGPTGEYVFELAVRQVYIDAIGIAAFAGLVVAVAVWSWRRAGDMDDFDRGPVRAICLIGVLLGSFLILWQLTHVLNPEYAALSNILSAVGGAR